MRELENTMESKKEILEEIKNLREEFKEDLERTRPSSVEFKRSFADQLEQAAGPLVFIMIVLMFIIVFSGKIYKDYQLDRLAIEKGYVQVYDKEAKSILWKKEK